VSSQPLRQLGCRRAVVANIAHIFWQMPGPENPAATGALSGKEPSWLSEMYTVWRTRAWNDGLAGQRHAGGPSRRGASVKLLTLWNTFFRAPEDPASRGRAVRPSAQSMVIFLIPGYYCGAGRRALLAVNHGKRRVAQTTQGQGDQLSALLLVIAWCLFPPPSRTATPRETTGNSFHNRFRHTAAVDAAASRHCGW
jgi:hypothetical protein